MTAYMIHTEAWALISGVKSRIKYAVHFEKCVIQMFFDVATVDYIFFVVFACIGAILSAYNSQKHLGGCSCATEPLGSLQHPPHCHRPAG